jgi:Spy/CpxP family protein refolding chaperone
MKPFAKIRVIIWLLLLFISGAVLGNASSSRWPAASLWQAAAGKPPETVWREYRTQTLRRVLDLTDEQVRRIEPALEQTEVELRRLREETGARAYAIIAANCKPMWPVLTPEQQEKFLTWFKESRAR